MSVRAVAVITDSNLNAAGTFYSVTASYAVFDEGTSTTRTSQTTVQIPFAKMAHEANQFIRKHIADAVAADPGFDLTPDAIFFPMTGG